MLTDLRAATRGHLKRPALACKGRGGAHRHGIRWTTIAYAESTMEMTATW